MFIETLIVIVWAATILKEGEIILNHKKETEGVSLQAKLLITFAGGISITLFLLFLMGIKEGLNYICGAGAGQI